MPQRADRVFDIDPDIPHVSCMGCGAVMLACVDTKKIPFGTALLVPNTNMEDVEVFIRAPFTQEITKTHAYYGFVMECPYCILQHEEHVKGILVGMSIPLTT